MKIDPFEYIRQKPEMFWGPRGPSAQNLISGMVEQLIILGCEAIKLYSKNGWYFLGAESDWISGVIPDGENIEYPFKHMQGFPEANVGGAPRSEIFFYDFAERLIVWYKEQAILLKGDPEPEFNNYFQSKYGNGVALAFYGNTYV